VPEASSDCVATNLIAASAPVGGASVAASATELDAGVAVGTATASPVDTPVVATSAGSGDGDDVIAELGAGLFGTTGKLAALATGFATAGRPTTSPVGARSASMLVVMTSLCECATLDTPVVAKSMASTAGDG
jgi:hypothetical protein